MAKESLKQIAYRRIREKIESCEYEPASFLNEDILCKDLEMSRTPVRDALGRLEQEGLLQIYPKKGVFVKPFSVMEINNVFECRMILEPYIISNYCRDPSEEFLAALKKKLDQEVEVIRSNKGKEWQYDDEFHDAIVNSCTNPYLLRTLQSVKSQNNRTRNMCFQTPYHELERTIADHTAIYEAIANKEPEKAAQLMREHLVHAKENTFYCLTATGTPVV